MTAETMLERTRQARAVALASLGRVRKVIARPQAPPLAPAWGAGGARLRILLRDDLAIVVTDGLTDPFDGAPHALASPYGLGVELALVIDDPVTDDELAESWPARLVFAAGDWAIGFRDILGLRARFRSFTVGLPAVAGLDRFVAANGRIGVLVGTPVPGLPTTIALPMQEALVMPMKLLRAEEYEWALANGDAAGERLAEQFASRGDWAKTSLRRPPVFGATARPRGELVVVDGPSKGVTVVVGDERVHIGRRVDCELRLGDPAVGRIHATVERVDDEFVFHDLRSSMGSFVGDLAVERHVLRDGDVVRVGATSVAFRLVRDRAGEPHR